MKPVSATIWSALMVLHLLWARPCRASFLEMSLERNSIYTPGRMRLVMKLADEAAVQGSYAVGISVVTEEVIIRNQILPVAKDAPAVFELDFPAVRNRTNVRCRAELSIDGNFIEAREEPLLLWPPVAPIEKAAGNKTIWVFDVSGGLQRIFKDLQVSFSDATFQAIRDFQMPDIVFVGENLGLKSFDTLLSRILVKDENLRALVFLRQEVFPEAWPVQALSTEASAQSISCDPNRPLLSGLNRFDIMNMLSGVTPVGITTPKDEEWELDWHIGESGKGEKQTSGYLAVVRQTGLTTVYCQVPITGDFAKEPRSAVLLRNLLHFAYGECVPRNR
ncbi:MAG TPA: hypothetical protein VMX13_17545 [Sedimentisphaerales bacterium]|nr:hypothetical protein [Sedimentisphaerales bacterium]